MPVKTRIDKGSNKTQGITSPVAKRLYTLKEASVYLARPVYGVRELIWNKRLPVIQEGERGKQYVDILDLDRYVEQTKRVTG